jgi:hypothetical protein
MHTNDSNNNTPLLSRSTNGLLRRRLRRSLAAGLTHRFISLLPHPYHPYPAPLRRRPSPLSAASTTVPFLCIHSTRNDVRCYCSVSSAEDEIHWVLEEVRRYLSPDIKVRRADVLGGRPVSLGPKRCGELVSSGFT